MGQFDFDFTHDKLAAILNRANVDTATWHTALLATLPKYNITTINRVAAFLAQCAHESNGFTELSENLNYGVAGLMATWAKRFPADVAGAYARRPEKIANRAYANRMGNGPEESGDGWKFRGRGLIQITGHDNYAALSTSLNMLLDECIAYCATPAGAIESACWFWTKHHLNSAADAGDIVSMTKTINGGVNGLEDRVSRYNSALLILKG